MAYLDYTGGILSDQVKLYVDTTGWTATAKEESVPTTGYIKKLYYESSGTTYDFYTCDGARYYKVVAGATASTLPAKFWIPQMQSTPSLGGTTDKVEVTCLEDGSRRYIPGLVDYGDSLDFAFLYDRNNYGILNGLGKDDVYKWIIEFRTLAGQTTGDKFEFDAKASVSMDEITVGNAMTFTFSAAIQSEIKYTAGN